MLWALRAGWFALPLTAGPAIASSLDGTSTAVSAVAAASAWVAWGIVLVAVLVPRTTSLTALRIGAPAAFGAAVWAGIRGGVGGTEMVALAWTAVLAAAVLFLPVVADVFVDGSSYGPERRLALRVPGALLLGPVEVTWAITVASLTTGPLLLAARQWVLGVLALVAGVAGARFGIIALHRLSRRWVVLVPAGLVLHDHVVLGEAVLFPKRIIKALGPAEAGTTATDATGRALGLVLELQLYEPNRVLKTETDRVLFSPARPGALLREARERGFPVT